MLKPGDIISYNEMCLEEGYSLQRGMNFRVKNDISIILMSVRKNSPYADRIENNGKVLIYEGHDVPRNISNNPKEVDQPRMTPNGKLTQNGKFEKAALNYKKGIQSPELVKVYEKIKSGIWVYNGVFELQDAWIEKSNGRDVFKFKLLITDFSIKQKMIQTNELKDIEHNRLIPTSVKIEVFKRDKGKCVQCGSKDNLHFDHILPYSKGGTSLKAENIQLLCARHNLKKSNKIV
jgi:hypothetical protein